MFITTEEKRMVRGISTLATTATTTISFTSVIIMKCWTVTITSITVMSNVISVTINTSSSIISVIKVSMTESFGKSRECCYNALSVFFYQRFLHLFFPKKHFLKSSRIGTVTHFLR